MGKAVILSIAPKYAKAIYEGRKHWEFRTQPPPVGYDVYLYETAPVCRVTGAMSFCYAVSGVPEYVWNVVKSLGHFHLRKYNKPGISRQQFYEYCKGKESVTALRIEVQVKMDTPQLLPDGVRPPQNWCYVATRDKDGK